MSARTSNGLRAFVTVLCASIPLAPPLVSGCGSSSASPSPTAPTASTETPSPDAAIKLVTVVTTGGGGPPSSSGDGGRVDGGASAASSGSPLGVDPFGSGSGSSSGSGAESGSSDLSEAGPSDSSSGEPSEAGPSSGSGASSGSGSSGSGAASGSGSSSGGDASSGSGSSSGSPDASTNACLPYSAPLCGSLPCDLRTSVCCVNTSFQARCVSLSQGTCDSDEASVHCATACDCTGGQVCCGVDNLIVDVVQSQCQTVQSGGHCVPVMATSTQASVQLCKVDSECKNNQPCTLQTCYSVQVNLCGLQSAYPYNCTAD
jgi:hypothetical protein